MANCPVTLTQCEETLFTPSRAVFVTKKEDGFCVIPKPSQWKRSNGPSVSTNYASQIGQWLEFAGDTFFESIAHMNFLTSFNFGLWAFSHNPDELDGFDALLRGFSRKA
jgi:hypothetical protein